MRVRTHPVPTPQPRPPAASHTARMTPGAIAGAAIAGALIALAFGATSAAAQAYAPDGAYVDEVVVTPSYTHSSRDGVDRLSRAVSVRDLDLTTYAGRDLLNQRIRITARDLCRELGEDRFSGSTLGTSCEAQAIRGVRPQVRLAVNEAYARPAYASLDTPYPYDDRVYP